MKCIRHSDVIWCSFSKSEAPSLSLPLNVCHTEVDTKLAYLVTDDIVYSSSYAYCSHSNNNRRTKKRPFQTHQWHWITNLAGAVLNLCGNEMIVNSDWEHLIRYYYIFE